MDVLVALLQFIHAFAGVSGSKPALIAPRGAERPLVPRSRRLFATDDLYNVLLGVTANRGTLQAICTEWLKIADPETIRGYLNDQLRVEDLPELERQLNAGLAAQISRRIYPRPQDVAIDFHDRRYCGKQPESTGLLSSCSRGGLGA